MGGPGPLLVRPARAPPLPGARAAKGAQESKQRQRWTFVTNSAAGKSPGAQVTWKLKPAPTPQSWAPNTQWLWARRTLARSLRSPAFCLAKVGLHLRLLCRNGGGRCPGTQTEWKDPASPWGVPSARPPGEEHTAPAHPLLGGRPRAERGCAPRGWPPRDTGAAGVRCTHLAALLPRRAFFARVPLSGERRPALARGPSRPAARRPPATQLAL